MPHYREAGRPEQGTRGGRRLPVPSRQASPDAARRWRLTLLVVLAAAPFVFLAPVIARGELAYGDIAWQHVPFWQFSADALRQGHLPLWDPWTYVGFPYAASSLPAVFYPATLLFLVLPAEVAAYLALIAPLATAGVFTYLLLRDQEVGEFGAFTAGLAAGLAGAMNAQIGHAGLATIAGWFPAQLFLVNRLQGRRPLAYFWLLTAVATLQLLAGFPQLAAYAFLATLVYALVNGLALRSAGPFARQAGLVAAALALAFGVSQFALLPGAELAAESSRASATFAYFSEGSYMPLSALTLAFPWLFGGGLPPFNGTPWGPYDLWWERVQFVGVLALPPMVIALRHFRTDPRVRAFVLLAGAILVLALGANTPLHRALYALPVYGSFRISTRYVILLGPALAALAGIGLDYIRRRPIGVRRLLIAGLVGMAALAWAGFVGTAATAPNALRQFGGELAAGGPRLMSPAVLWPLAVLAAGVLLLGLMARWRRARSARVLMALFVLLYAVDLGSFAWFFHGVWPREAVFDTAGLKECLGDPAPPEPDRPNRAAHVEMVLRRGGGYCSPNYALRTGGAMATGYDSLTLRRLRDLLGGAGYSQVLAGEVALRHAPLLDALGVRYLLAQAAPPAAPSVLDPGPQRTTFQLSLPAAASVRAKPDARRVTAIELVSWLANAADLPDGSVVAEIRFTTADGARRALPVRAGVETAEWAWDDPVLRGRVRHGRAPVAFDFAAGSDAYRGHAYVARWALDEPIEIRDLELVTDAGGATLVVERIALQERDSGRLVPLTMRELLLGSGYYREVSRNETVVVLENPTALPRSWAVPEVREAAPEVARVALTTGQLPEGGGFDPRRLALVEPNGGATPAAGLGATTRTHVRSYQPGRIELDVSAAGDAFIVVSEAYYPGWTAAIDGKPSRLWRADYALMGLAVPGGEHRVVLWYEPRVYRLGSGISLATLGAAALVSGFLARRRIASRAPGADVPKSSP